MRTLRELLPRRKHPALPRAEGGLLDEKTVFYIAKKVFQEEYGVRGSENIIPTLYQKQNLFLSGRSSLWSNEVWLERERLREKINALLGEEAVKEIKVKHD